MNSIIVSVEEMPVNAFAGTIAGFLHHHGLNTNQITNNGRQLVYVSHGHHVVWLSISPEKQVAVMEGLTERPLAPSEVKILLSRSSSLEDVLQVLWPVDPEVRYRTAVGMVR